MSEATAIDPRLKQILDDMEPTIRANVEEAAAKTVTETMSWSLKNAVEQATDEYIKSEILPKVREELVARHDELVQAIAGSVAIIADKLRDSLVDRFSKNVTESYKVQKMVEHLFGY